MNYSTLSNFMLGWFLAFLCTGLTGSVVAAVRNRGMRGAVSASTWAGSVWHGFLGGLRWGVITMLALVIIGLIFATAQDIHVTRLRSVCRAEARLGAAVSPDCKILEERAAWRLAALTN